MVLVIHSKRSHSPNTDLDSHQKEIQIFPDKSVSNAILHSAMWLPDDFCWQMIGRQIKNNMLCQKVASLRF